MERSKFKTKLTKKQRKKNVLVIGAVFICCYIFVLFFYLFVIGDGTEFSNLPETLVIVLAMTFFVISVLMSPVIIVAIVLGLQKGKAKRVRDNATFIATQDIEYYRDNLNELNPSLVSLLIDLDIYGKKDIVATLLRLQNKKIISFQESGHLLETSEDKQHLDNSERELLSMVKNNTLNDSKLLSKWREDRFLEAESMGYIKKREIIENRFNPVYIMVGFFSVIIGIFLWHTFIFSDIVNNMDTVLDFIIICIMLLMLDILMSWPLYYLGKLAGYRKRGDVIWERTQLGNETAEKIAGLSRFIHEFSSLSKAKKEEVVLWDDYLVYALVLEENEQIVKDISKQYKVNWRDFSKLK